MSLFSYHLVKASCGTAIRAVLRAPRRAGVPGLIHAEWMSAMTLGAPVFSSARVLIRQVAVFMQWEDEQALERFLSQNQHGKLLAAGWHMRLHFIRQWGKISGFKVPAADPVLEVPCGPVVAVTIARMKFREIPRFIRWGRPVEQLVRDHPGALFSLASIRLPNTVSTFSVWRSVKEMTDMVGGHSAVPRPERHADAMKERDRKDFHFEFTTLRFQPVAQFGTWNGGASHIPGLKAN